MADWVELLELHRRAEEGNAEACNRLGELLLKSAPVEILELQMPRESMHALESRLAKLFAELDGLEELRLHRQRQQELDMEITYVRTQMRAIPLGVEAALQEHRDLRERSLREAFFYFELSAKLGDAEGMWNTGWRYWLGEGTDKNQTMANFWWIQAAARGHSSAISKLFSIIMNKETEYRQLEQAIRHGVPRLRRDPLEMLGKPLKKLTVFLCHSSVDKNSVRELKQRLDESGFNTWFDEANLPPGVDWPAAIRKAIEEVDVVIVCLSQNSVTRAGFVQSEIEMALEAARRQPEGRIFVIPALLEPVQIPDRLQRWQYVKLYEERGYEQLTAGLRSRAKVFNL